MLTNQGMDQDSPLSPVRNAILANGGENASIGVDLRVYVASAPPARAEELPDRWLCSALP